MTDRTLRAPADLAGLRFDRRGLLPVVAQDAATGRALMVAWANRDALEASLESGELHFWSRSRRRLWKKGETSGNVLRLRSLHADCDLDTVLALVDPTGPTCHTGEENCFGDLGDGGAFAGAQKVGDPVTTDDATASAAVLADLWNVIQERARTRPDESYTTRLLSDENLRLKKLGEETTELVTALARGEHGRVSEEAADLLYHLLVALRGAGVELGEVMAVLSARSR